MNLKPLLTISILVILSSTVAGQTKKTINDYQSLVSTLTTIKSGSEDLARNVKKEWETTEVRKPAEKPVPKTEKDTLKKKTLPVANAKTKNTPVKVAKDSKNTIDTTKKDTSKVAIPAKTPKMDSSPTGSKAELAIKFKSKYSDLRSSVDGVIAEFQTIIKKPKLINDAFRDTLKNHLQLVINKSDDLKSFYDTASLNLQKGSNFTVPTVVGTIVEVLFDVYTNIIKIKDTERAKDAADFKAQCGLTAWIDLK